MENEQAVRLVDQTFGQTFDRDQFSVFVKNLFNTFEEKPFDYRGNLIPDAYANFIGRYERLGKYKDPQDREIDILIVYLKRSTSLDKARTMQRNFIARYLNGSRGGQFKDAALVAFVSPDEEDWRLSLVKMEYKDFGKTQELTPARRYSFLVGAHESSHTARKQLFPYLKQTVPLTLDDLVAAFSVEKVTKEFFELYRELFTQLNESLTKIVGKNSAVGTDFTAKDIKTADFAKKLLGQVVFIYFLQKKGWFGVPEDKSWGDGDRHFLRHLFDKAHVEYENFFNDILEPLFYEALAKERDDDYYSRFKCRIPFLNGGLFDPIGGYDWVNTRIEIPDEVFSNTIRTKQGDVGTGILDIFDRYNFTIKEDEPLEKEVAVDPEMLGKIFENLIEENLRKGQGTYYTPREIVHYMCQKSLESYLVAEIGHKIPARDIESLLEIGELAVEHDTRVTNVGNETTTYSFKLPETVRKNAELIDGTLEKIRILDPAVGSGAFPVGMMIEIIRIRNALTPYINGGRDRSVYDFKRHAIQRCLYGVDIDSGAIEICRLRLWLSLVVDETERKIIQPLPNLDYKIVCGDSLRGIDTHDMFVDFSLKELEQIKTKFFRETNARNKKNLQKRIDELIKEITHGHQIFDFGIYFSEVFHEGGFSIVITNPPYGAEFPKEYKKYFKEAYKSTGGLSGIKGSFDTFSLFIDRGLQLTQSRSALAYIVPLALTSSDSMAALHEELLGKCESLWVSTYSNRPHKIFASADQRIAILLAKRTGLQNKNIFTTKVNKRYTSTSIEDVINNLHYVDSKNFLRYGRIPKVGTDLELAILNKIFQIPNNINDFIDEAGLPVYYRAAGGRYYNIVTTYPTGSTQEKKIDVKAEYQNLIGGILTSNLFYWFLHIYSDQLHIKTYELQLFPIPKVGYSEKVLNDINITYEKYLRDLENNAIVKKGDYVHVNSFKEYTVRKSKRFIDKIDNLIAASYGLNNEEVNFLIEFDLEFRLSE